MIYSCSNTVLIFRFICNKCQCFLTICFIFGNTLLFVQPKGILFYSFLLTCNVSKVFSLCCVQFLIVAEIFYLSFFLGVKTLNPRFINDFFKICRFFGTLKFERLLTICVILSVI